HPHGVCLSSSLLRRTPTLPLSPYTTLFRSKSKASFDFKNITLPGSSSPLDLLKSLLDRAKVEESNFPVAAIAETKEGFVSGVNIECSAWNMGLCAERIAISKALTYTVSNINALHIHTRFGEFSSPCGACRQIIREH